MNERSLMPTPDPGGQGGWLDNYMPENQLAHYQPQKSQFINIAAIRGLLYRQRWLVGVVVAAALIAGFVLTMLATPMYEARSSVRIEPNAANIVVGQDLEQGVTANQVNDLLSTHMGVITSRNLAQRVAEDLNLGERMDFLGPEVEQSRPPNMTDQEWAQAKQNMAVDLLVGSVVAERPTNNWILEIGFRSENPQIAAEMANAYAAAFSNSETRESLENNQYAQEYLQEQIALIRGRLQEAEQAANNYARNSGIIVQSLETEEGSPGATLTTTNLANINARVSAAQAARIEAEQRWRSVQNLPATQLSEVQNNSLLQGLIAERTSAESRLAELRGRYFDAHPENAAVIARIETLDRQIESTSADIKSAIRNEYVVARNREEALRAELANLTGETLAEQDQQVEYSVLEREAQALRDQLQALLERYNEITTASNVDTGTINALDMAVVPGSPYSPNLFRNMVMALVFGIALAAGLAVVRETIDDKVRSVDDFEERMGMPMLGYTPYVKERDIEYEGNNRFGALMEAYASIRATIDFSLSKGQNVIQLTSSQESEGKSTTAVILAELFASLGRRTLLIDADLRRPSVASLLEIERPKVGLVEVLLGQADLQSAVVRGVHDNLDILPISEIPSNPTEILASSRLREFIEANRDNYSLIIFDSCPVLGLADAPLLARIVDGTIFVLEANRIRYGQARTAMRRIQQAGGYLLGGIVTKYRALEAGQEYNYQYSYYRYGNDGKAT